MYSHIFKDSDASTKAWKTRGKSPAKLNGLGILRKDMPQIKSADMKEFFAFAAKEHGVVVTSETVKVDSLKPSQNEYNAEQASQIPDEALRKPLTVSSDGYLLDGHNRWAKLLADDQSQPVEVYKIHLKARAALKLMHSFPKSFRKDVSEVGATKT